MKVMISNPFGAVIRCSSNSQPAQCVVMWVNTEIAQMMNKNEGAIRALQYRALRSLQTILEAEEAKDLEFAPIVYFDAAAS